eukprot:421161-Rhodomonas_salina.1
MQYWSIIATSPDESTVQDPVLRLGMLVPGGAALVPRGDCKTPARVPYGGTLHSTECRDCGVDLGVSELGDAVRRPVAVPHRSGPINSFILKFIRHPSLRSFVSATRCPVPSTR